MTEKTEKSNREEGDFKKDIRFPSESMAIVDMTVLYAVDSEEVKNAIVIPLKTKDVQVEGKLEDGNIRKISIMPKEMKKDSKEVTEGLLPAGIKSNDDRIMARMREVTSPAAKKKNSTHRGTLTTNPMRRVGRLRKRGTRGKHTARMLNNSIDPKMKEIIEFIIKTVNADKILSEDIDIVKDKELLRETIEKMYSMCVKGWVIEEGKLIHTQTKVEANVKAWDIKDGMLVGKDGKSLDIDFDWAFKAREAIREYTKIRNVNMVEDIIQKYGKQIRE